MRVESSGAGDRSEARNLESHEEGSGAVSKLGRRALLEQGAAAVACTLTACVRARDLEPSAGEDGARLAALPEPLLPDPDGVLDLPAGFSYTLLHGRFARMDDGHRTPGRPDAMACFAGPDDSIVLMRNHELSTGHGDPGPYFPEQSPVREAYDPASPGAVTRLVLDARTLEVRRSNLVLAGTSWNCAGGPSPWGWLSCEETVEPGHGYVFLCAIDADRVQPAQRVDGYGRFRHEAAAVDARTLIAYLTEDRTDACFYRFVPDSLADPFRGKLQALRLPSRPGLHTSDLRPGTRLQIDWVDVDDPVPQDDSVRVQARARGAAVFSRTEGLWLAGGEAFMTATTGGPIGRGQVFRLDLDRGTLEVLAESNDPDVLDMPDNLTLSPHGVLYVAEDAFGGNFVRRIELDGRLSPFARNALSGTELAGVCFSPDGSTLFVNMQEEALTLAVRGPFDQLARATPSSPARGRRASALGLSSLALRAAAWPFVS